MGLGSRCREPGLITHPVVQGKLTYLESGASFDVTLWYKAIPSNNEYPHATWWGCTEDTTSDGGREPTWGDYPEQWSVAKLWWKSDLIIGNLLFLRSMHTKPDQDSNS